MAVIADHKTPSLAPIAEGYSWILWNGVNQSYYKNSQKKNILQTTFYDRHIIKMSHLFLEVVESLLGKRNWGTFSEKTLSTKGQFTHSLILELSFWINQYRKQNAKWFAYL